MYIVTVRSANAPKSRGGQYRRPVHVRVMDANQSEWHAVRGLNDGIVWVRRNVDSRYDGPRSEYGKAIREAQKIADTLNSLQPIILHEPTQSNPESRVRVGL